MRRRYHNIIDPHHLCIGRIAVTFRCNQFKQNHGINIIDCVQASTFFVRWPTTFFLALRCLHWPFGVCYITRCSSILSNLRVVIILWQYFTQTQLNWCRRGSSFKRLDTLNRVVNERRDETYLRIMNTHTYTYGSARMLSNVLALSLIYCSGIYRTFVHFHFWSFNNNGVLWLFVCWRLWPHRQPHLRSRSRARFHEIWKPKNKSW